MNNLINGVYVCEAPTRVGVEGDGSFVHVRVDAHPPQRHAMTYDLLGIARHVMGCRSAHKRVRVDAVNSIVRNACPYEPQKDIDCWPGDSRDG